MNVPVLVYPPLVAPSAYSSKLPNMWPASCAATSSCMWFGQPPGSLRYQLVMFVPSAPEPGCTVTVWCAPPSTKSAVVEHVLHQAVVLTAVVDPDDVVEHVARGGDVGAGDGDRDTRDAGRNALAHHTTPNGALSPCRTIFTVNTCFRGPP